MERTVNCDCTAWSTTQKKGAVIGDGSGSSRPVQLKRGDTVTVERALLEMGPATRTLLVRTREGTLLELRERDLTPA